MQCSIKTIVAMAAIMASEVVGRKREREKERKREREKERKREREK
jgi:hypothetical protein